ncbi:hypothetical protein ACFLYW_04235 [Thermodesulfobacteriota bacterium]
MVSDESAEEDPGSERDAEDYKKYIRKSSKVKTAETSMGSFGNILRKKLKEKEKKQ